MANMIPISTVTVGSGGASSIEFSGIPQNYTDLKLVYSARSTYALVGVDVNFTINGSSSSYTGRILYGTGTGTGSASQTSGSTFTWGGYISGASATSNTFGNNEFYFPNYTSSNNKSISIDGVSEHNGSESYQQLTANLWSNTSPISSIKLTPAYGNFAQYSSATLYGIRKY